MAPNYWGFGFGDIGILTPTVEITLIKGPFTVDTGVPLVF